MDSSSYQSMSSPSSPGNQSGKRIINPPALDTRPDVRTANTVIPLVESPKSRRGLRVRATTSPERQTSASFPSLTNRRRSGTNSQAQQQPPRQLDLASLGGRPSLRGTLSPLEESTPDKPTEPIPIPPRKQDRGPFSPTGTPLTARAPSGNYFPQLSEFTHSRPRISQSLTPSYSRASTTTKMPRSETGPNVQRGFVPTTPRAKSPLYTPSSPLSATAPRNTLSPSSRHKERRPGQNLNLAGLPKFHPANFPSGDSNSITSLSQNKRSITSQPRPGRGSDAQQKMHQYQRDLVANAGKYAKPNPPRLTPLRSPGEPMTPLMLEGQGDYLCAGSASLSPKGDGREMVERLIRRENERRIHPEAKAGSASPAVSPAVSPAGGRG